MASHEGIGMTPVRRLFWLGVVLWLLLVAFATYQAGCTWPRLDWIGRR